MKDRVQVKEPSRATAAPAAARIHQTVAAIPAHKADRPVVVSHLERAARLGHSFAAPGARIPPSPPLQLKQVVGPVGDRYVQEANQVARHALRLHNEPAPPAAQSVQRQEAWDSTIRGKAEVSGEGGGASEVRRESRPDLPDILKAGLEHLSGLAMDDVRVHYNSSKPAEINAHAFTKGKDIQIASGQEKHLPHEGWHVVQQAQGRVKPTMRANGAAINADPGLEHEAYVMGRYAVASGEELQTKATPSPAQRQTGLEGKELLLGKLAAAKTPSKLQRTNGPPVMPISRRNETVIQRDTTEVPRPTNGFDISRVDWDPQGRYGSVVWINIRDTQEFASRPRLDWLDPWNQRLLDQVRIAKVEMDPTKKIVMLYPQDPAHGVWRILNVDGNPSWQLVSEVETEERGHLWWKAPEVTNVKTREYLAGIADLENPTATQIATRVFNNMQSPRLKYATHGGTPDSVANGAPTGQCHAVNGGLGILIQAALASRRVEADVRKVDEKKPFMTLPAGYGNNVIGENRTNIVTQKIGEADATPYTGNAIKFDNHSWITVGGKVYDLIAGIVDGDNSCVHRRLTKLDDKEYDVHGEAPGTKLVKIEAAVGAPWKQAYELRRPD